MNRERIYVASSWRNAYQPEVVEMLRGLGHEVYDFRNPAPGNTGFSWREIDEQWKTWTPEQYREAMKHPTAVRGYKFDKDALVACTCCILVVPAGRSASFELGYAMGFGKKGFLLALEPFEAELMFREATVLVSREELISTFEITGAR